MVKEVRRPGEKEKEGKFSSRTELELGRRCGHPTLDTILSHHNESVHG